tara:strand:- start:1894 stop:2502 length:609 start_codon:yes stop_codon:yes gene_type:complete
MTAMIIDYGAGNIRSVYRALHHIGLSPIISAKESDLSSAELVILPGQGSFGPLIKQLESLNLLTQLRDYILSDRPFIGICIGFQMLFEGSEESPGTKGLGIFPGHLKKFDEPGLTVPHMGWNDIVTTDKANLAIPDRTSCAYFAHSYYLPTTLSDIISSTTQYGSTSFVSTIQSKSLLATQFHPEKSSQNGLNILKTFISSL